MIPVVRPDETPSGEGAVREALNGVLWLNLNRDNYGSPEWLSYFDSAVEDVRRALDGLEMRKDPS